MSEVKTYAVNCNDAWLNTDGDDISDSYVKYSDYIAIATKLDIAEKRIAEIESALNRHYDSPDVYDMAIKQFESLSNHKHHFINGTCVECMKSE